MKINNNKNRNNNSSSSSDDSDSKIGLTRQGTFPSTKSSVTPKILLPSLQSNNYAQDDSDLPTRRKKITKVIGSMKSNKNNNNDEYVDDDDTVHQFKNAGDNNNNKNNRNNNRMRNMLRGDSFTRRGRDRNGSLDSNGSEDSNGNIFDNNDDYDSDPNPGQLPQTARPLPKIAKANCKSKNINNTAAVAAAQDKNANRANTSRKNSNDSNNSDDNSIDENDENKDDSKDEDSKNGILLRRDNSIVSTFAASARVLHPRAQRKVSFVGNIRQSADWMR